MKKKYKIEYILCSQNIYGFCLCLCKETHTHTNEKQLLIEGGTGVDGDKVGASVFWGWGAAAL